MHSVVLRARSARRHVCSWAAVETVGPDLPMIFSLNVAAILLCINAYSKSCRRCPPPLRCRGFYDESVDSAIHRGASVRTSSERPSCHQNHYTIMLSINNRVSTHSLPDDDNDHHAVDPETTEEANEQKDNSKAIITVARLRL